VGILKVVGIDSSPAYLSPPAAGDPCNKVGLNQHARALIAYLSLAAFCRKLVPAQDLAKE
jgi:hypothetical protein